MMFLGKLLTALIGNDDVIVDSGLAKKPFCHFAVWTGKLARNNKAQKTTVVPGRKSQGQTRKEH